MNFSSFALAMGQSGGAGVQGGNPIAAFAPLVVLIIVGYFIFFHKKKFSYLSNSNADNDNIYKNTEPIVKTYIGKQETARKKFLRDSEILAPKGYYPVSENWEQGSWGCSTFLVALFLCIFIVGIFIFIYMIIVKPAGKLVVTYEYREPDKICPKCAEKIKNAARVCRYCGYEFPDSTTNETV